MKFPSLSSTLKLLKPHTKKQPKSNPNSSPALEMCLYDKIEEIISIVDAQYNSEIILQKFYHLNEIQQQITIITLIEHKMNNILEVIFLSNYDVNYLIKGQSPLHFAIKDENLKMISLLIKYKADLELKDNYKETALNCAVRTGNTSIVKYLLEQGVDVNTEASDSSTPLAYAIQKGDIESVNILGKYGALLGSSFSAKTCSIRGK